MDLQTDTIRYSVWKRTVKSEDKIGTKSFEALFEKWDKGNPKKQMHNFLKAYACAVHNIVVVKKEDRFPKLNEIETACPEILKDKGQREVVFNLKRRFIKETNFFDEIPFGRQGVYLKPKALRFKDESDSYSDLVFDFDKGTVTLPGLKTELGSEGIGKRLVEQIESEKLLETNSNQFKIKALLSKKFILFFSLLAIVLVTFLFLIFAPPDKPISKGEKVLYSIYSSKDDKGDFLMFELSNPNGTEINSMIVLPKEIDKMISVESGVVSVSHSNNTIISLKTDKDARIKIYVSVIEIVPIMITHTYEGNAVPSIYGINNYTVLNTNEKIQVNFELKNSTLVKIRIEQ